MPSPYQIGRIWWRSSDLLALREDAAAGLTLVEMAKRRGGQIHSGDCDLALWALTGRTVEEACHHLNFRDAA